MNRIVKYVLLFTFLFLMNIFIFGILATLGFQVTMSENSYMVPPGVCVYRFIHYSQKKWER